MEIVGIIVASREAQRWRNRSPECGSIHFDSDWRELESFANVGVCEAVAGIKNKLFVYI
jgi:hypothetical protein